MALKLQQLATTPKNLMSLAASPKKEESPERKRPTLDVGQLIEQGVFESAEPAMSEPIPAAPDIASIMQGTEPESYTPPTKEQILRGIDIVGDPLVKGATMGVLGKGGALERVISDLTGGRFQPGTPARPETVAEKAIATGAEMAGSIAPITKLINMGKLAVTKVIPKTATGITAKVARTLGPEAFAGAAYEGGTALVEGKSPSEAVKEAAIGAGTFAALGGAARGIEAGVKKLLHMARTPKAEVPSVAKNDLEYANNQQQGPAPEIKPGFRTAMPDYTINNLASLETGKPSYSGSTGWEYPQSYIDATARSGGEVATIPVQGPRAVRSAAENLSPEVTEPVRTSPTGAFATKTPSLQGGPQDYAIDNLTGFSGGKDFTSTPNYQYPQGYIEAPARSGGQASTVIPGPDKRVIRSGATIEEPVQIESKGIAPEKPEVITDSSISIKPEAPAQAATMPTAAAKEGPRVEVSTKGELAPQKAVITTEPIVPGEKSAEISKTTPSLVSQGLNLARGETANGNPVWELSGNTEGYKKILQKLGGREQKSKGTWSFYGDRDPTEKIMSRLSSLEGEKGVSKIPQGHEMGNAVIGPGGKRLTVIDSSDPSMLLVRNEKGSEFKIGRKAVKPLSSEEIQAARKEIQNPEELLKVVETPKGTTTLYSGIPVEAISDSVEMAGKKLADVAGKPVGNVKILQSEQAKQPGIMSSLQSPSRVARSFPEAKPYVDDGMKSTTVQERLRKTFNYRLQVIDEVLGTKGFARVKDPLNKTYTENKKLLHEVLLTGDIIGKKFSAAELRSDFGANEQVIRAYNLTRSAYDRAYGISSAAKEARGKDPVAYREGYIPHFFHNYFITVDGQMAGSARTLREAVQMSNPVARTGAKVTIIPKKFEHPGEASQAAVLGDMSYFKLKNKVEKEFSMSADEASQLLDGVARMKGRSRFVGNFLERKGVKGWDKNLDWVNRHYFNMVSRFAALDHFKASAITRFERQFGKFDNEHTGIAGYIKNYINDVNGNPTQMEELLNATIARSPAISQFLGKYLGDRASLQIAGATTKGVAIAKLGMFNISSALINTTQLLNAYGKLGEKWTAVGIRQAMASGSGKNAGLLKQMGIDVQLGLESGAGYSKAGMGKFFDASVFAFHKADNYLRRVTALGSYYKGIKEGMSHKQALEYGRKIVDATQFNYSIADSPAFIRRSGPVGQVLLQFKKFPVKQLEFIGQLKGAEKARFWIPFTLMSGYFAFPGVELLNNTVKNIFGVDPELELKKELMTWAGNDPTKSKMAEGIMYGLTSQAGADISKRVGMGDFIPSEAADFAGPAVSTVVRTAQLAGRQEWTDALRAISPAPGNLLLAMQKDGEISDPWNRGRLKMVLSPQERAVKAAGFAPVRESIERDTGRVIRYAEEQRGEKERKAIDEYIKAESSGDDKAIRKALSNIESLGINFKRIVEEQNKKQMTNMERIQDNIPKKQEMNYTNIENFGKR